MSNLRSIHDSGLAVHALQTLQDTFPGGLDLDPVIRDLGGTNVHRFSVPDPMNLGSMSDDGVVFDGADYESMDIIDDAPVVIVPCDSLIDIEKVAAEKRARRATGSAYGQLI